MASEALLGMAGHDSLIGGPPRLTSAVQARIGGLLTTLDLEEEFLARKRHIDRQRSSVGSADLTNGNDTLTWNIFLKECGIRDPVTAKSSKYTPIRKSFNSYLQKIATVADETLPASEAARVCYDVLVTSFERANNRSAIQKARSEVESVVGRIEDPLWAQIEASVKTLHGWQLEQRQTTVSGGKTTENVKEYGSERVFSGNRRPSADLLAYFAQFQFVEKKAPAVVCAEEESKEEPEKSRGVLAEDEVLSGGPWLLQKCALHKSQTNSPFSATDLATNIVRSMQSADSADQCQGVLFDLVGVEGLEFIQELISRRNEISNLSVEALAAPQPDPVRALNTGTKTSPSRSALPRRNLHVPVIGPSVSVATAEERRALKQRQKEERKQAKKAQRARQQGQEGPEGHLIDESDWLQTVGFDAEYLRQERQLGLQKQADYHRAYMQNPSAFLSEAPRLEYREKRGLGAGSTRRVQDGYEVVEIPAPVVEKTDKSSLVPISLLPEWAQLAFPGVTHLNRLQSELFSSAFHSSQNLLVCAPTGAGKTNVAMLAVLQQVGAHLDAAGVLQRRHLKIIYVAPMKALAQEVVARFSQRLAPLGLRVAELTGDMQMSRREIEETQVIVTTPEKWDVITRKGGHGSLVPQVKLLLIDEVHLLADERGAVIETLVARTLRLVEASQSPIRIVGLSATLPNYQDVGRFLRADPEEGVFFFDGKYRPVPLEQCFMGVTEKSRLRQLNIMNKLVYEKVINSLREGNQVMVFVHSRKDTVKTAEAIRELATKYNTLDEFLPPPDHTQLSRFRKAVDKSRNRDLQQLFSAGFGIHNAGMLRADRSLTEDMFQNGVIRVLCCTATLAWGVNLPAHTVIIKGTQVYNAEKGGFSDLSMLDVLQIFGRAGRPQYDTSGEAILITTSDKLNHYLGLLGRQSPIESSFVKALGDHLNAEVAAGTVTNMKEATEWLSYTYLYVRMIRNPLAYGVKHVEWDRDRTLMAHRKRLVEEAAQRLDQCGMLKFHKASGNLATTALGRVASFFYIKTESVQVFQEMLQPHLSDADILYLICSSTEFENIRVRDEELPELERLSRSSACCPLEVKGGLENVAGKANVLMQTLISGRRVSAFTLVSDSNYIAQNAARIARGLFEICLTRNWSSMAERLLVVAKSIDKRMWWWECPLRQFPHISQELILKLEDRHAKMDELAAMDPREIGQLMRHQRMGDKVWSAVQQFPKLHTEVEVQPITRGILRLNLVITQDFDWNQKLSGPLEPWWLWVEDSENEKVYHSEYVILPRPKKAGQVEPLHITFAIPIFQPIPTQYFVRILSDRWVGASSVVPVSFRSLLLPEDHPPHTDLLDLRPLPKAALREPQFESLFSFSFFNPIQTQIFHDVYHTDVNVLVGAPTGSGKTVAAELALMRQWRQYPGQAAVYIAPLKALSRERTIEWKRKFGGTVKKRVVELTGDSAPDMAAVRSADVLICTPEKWDSVSRGWRRRSFVTNVSLIIIDEIHLLGQDRGPVLEAVVSRSRFIASHTKRAVRIVGLSTALANARDLADWLGIKRQGLYNFRPSVRPIPMEVHIQGFPGKHYCPRMATMNKPAFAAIKQYSPTQPVLIFVSSRRQTRLTALDLISYCASEEDPKRFLHMDPQEMDMLLASTRDSSLKHTLAFGIGIHHAGLNPSDRDMVEELFCNCKIQILVCTSTLAWGVNFPAHLVVIKGTEYFDGKSGKYEDFPITDVLQMMGRAGRPQFDTKGIACIFVHEPKRLFYQKFLYEPFPVESSFKQVLHNNLNAEIASGTVGSKQEAVHYLSWTYFFRRLLANPSYYGLEDASAAAVQGFLLGLVEQTVEDLRRAGCVDVEEDFAYSCTPLGRIACDYYLEYCTVGLIRRRLTSGESERPLSVPGTFSFLVQLLTACHEFDELPVRHNEDSLNEELAAALPWGAPNEYSYDSPNTKAYLLLQCHFFRLPLPISDYYNDLKSVLDQSLRVVNAMADVAAQENRPQTVLNLGRLAQCLVQALSHDTPALQQIPHVSEVLVRDLEKQLGVKQLKDLLAAQPGRVRRLFDQHLGRKHAEAAFRALEHLPRIKVEASLPNSKPEAGQMLEVKLSFSIENAKQAKLRVSAPHFPKPTDHGLWLVLCDPAPADDALSSPAGRLLAVKRVGLRTKFDTTLQVQAPQKSGSAQITVHIVPDSVAGLDVTQTIQYNVQ